ncbi:MAG: response regulator [Treponema sp.]|nr:response regulator [Treponema sp.]
MTLNIRDSAARLEAVLSNYSGVIYSVDRNNIITLFNGLYLSKIGVTPSFLEGKNLNLAAKKNRHLDLIEYVKKTFEEGMPQDWFSEIDGKAFRAHTMPIFDENGKAVSLVGSLDDITDMKRLQTDLEAALEKAQDASRAKSNFLSNMSHEIRTPMNAIIGMTYIGKSASSIEKKDYAFDKIEGASNHLLGVINDVLEMSKIESGKFELSFIEFNFEKMLQKVVNVISFRVEEKKQNFSVYLDGKIPQSIIGDDQRLAQIITNLLSNAIKFTPDEGSIRLAAVLENEEAGVFTIKVSVADSGIGINAEQQSRLFSSFEQAESSTSRKFGGTGLGLAISKHIVELMGGKIWVESELGKGAVFSFLIQIKAGREVYASPLLSGVDWSKVRILAVDDESEVQEYFLQIAESLGIACDAVGSGEEALKLVQNNHTYDIFFIDWQMPGMNGIELSQKIKEIIKGDSTIILISAFESNEIEQEARMVGVNDFLPKPLFPSAVAGCINKYIGQHGMADDSKKPEETESFLGYRLLLAEDVEINREILITMLEPYNLEIESALNGQEAVEMFSTKPEHYDLIFMDLQMPEMDGYEATHLIRELNFPKAKEIPIIAMTANVFKEDIAKCLEAGMNDHLGKPLDFNEVLTKLRIYLKPLAPRGVEPLF